MRRLSSSWVQPPCSASPRRRRWPRNRSASRTRWSTRPTSSATSPTIDAALDELQTEDGIQLFVVFVDSFDGLDTSAWMQSTEELSGLGGNDALLAVAVEDGHYGFDVPDGADVTVAEADQLAGQAVEPEFADGDWAAGVVAFADILRTGEAPGSGRLRRAAGPLLVLGAIARRRRRRLPARPVAPPQAGGAAPAGAADREARPVRRDDDRGAAVPGEHRPAASWTRR